MDLVQINKIPPLRQSTQEMMACPQFYVEEVIKRNRLPAGMDSARGTEIHRTMAAYLAHCAAQTVSVDYEAFDRLSQGAGPLAAKILAGLRGGLEVDYQHLFSTEVTLSLDEYFNATHLVPEMRGIIQDSELPIHHQGTFDGLYLFPDQGKLRIDDFKSHAKPFNPDDKPQGREYALLAFKHFPWAMEVVFRLIFVRYKRLVREVTYTRDQLPLLIDAVRAARERQFKIHEDYENGKKIDAIAGNHCLYCPLLANAQCPIAKWNPQMQLTPQQRLNFNLWYGQFSKANNAAMKAYVQETGRNIVLKDYNGKAYTYGPVEQESAIYSLFKFTNQDMMEVKVINGVIIPVMPVVDLLWDYAEANQDDIDWMAKIALSSTSITKYTSAKKRVHLDQALKDSVEKITKTPLRVSRPLDAVPEEEEPDDEDDWPDEDIEL